MKHLPLPQGASQDNSVIQQLGEDSKWAPHIEKWLLAYDCYRTCSGNPFAVSPTKFDAQIGEDQKKLWDNRRGSGEIARMRQQRGLLSCPMCGSPVTGDLDHYLPRKSYPEFSIMRANLVPTCTHCNSAAKGDTVRGIMPERFIHPYYDQWASDALWRIEINRPLEAATFTPLPIVGLSEEREQIVDFHLEHVLGEQFHRSIENLWSTYPLKIANRSETPHVEDMINEAMRDLSEATITMGLNSWNAAFFRGLAEDDEALEFVHAKAIKIPTS